MLDQDRLQSNTMTDCLLSRLPWFGQLEKVEERVSDQVNVAILSLEI